MLRALLLFIPLSLALRLLVGGSALPVFVTSAIAVAVLAEWVHHATDQLAERLGSAMGGLLTVSFGSIAELVLAMFVLLNGNAQIASRRKSLDRYWPPAWPDSGEGHHSVLQHLEDDVWLIASSFTVWWAERAISRGRRLPAAAGLIITILLGSTFMGIQAVEWSNKDFSFASDSYGSFYFVTTGFHMAHVAVGLLLLLGWLLEGGGAEAG